MKKLITTTKGGPCIEDIHSRRTWDLATGKLLDECVVEDTKESWLNREIPECTDIRVELTLKKAAVMFERRGPDVCEVFSQPRVCHEAGSMDNEKNMLTPGWSLDLTTVDPVNGKPWDLR